MRRHVDPALGVQPRRAVELDPSAIRYELAGQHRQQGGLAGPVRPEHREDLPRCHLEFRPQCEVGAPELDVGPQSAHSCPSTALGRATTITSSATTTSSSDIATAASTSDWAVV